MDPWERTDDVHRLFGVGGVMSYFPVPLIDAQIVTGDRIVYLPVDIGDAIVTACMLVDKSQRLGVLYGGGRRWMRDQLRKRKGPVTCLLCLAYV